MNLDPSTFLIYTFELESRQKGFIVIGIALTLLIMISECFLFHHIKMTNFHFFIRYFSF